MLLYHLVAGRTADDPDRRFDAWRTIDVDALLRLVLLENAAPLLDARLRTLPEPLLPAETRTRIANLARAWTLKLRLLEQRVAEAAQLLAAHGIPLLLLKGAALAQTVYDGFVDRPLADVDVLVDPADAAHAHELLQRHGWAPAATAFTAGAWDSHHHLLPLEDRQGSRLRLELHVAPLEPGHPFHFDAGHLRASARPVLLHGVPVLIPEPHRHAVHVAVHFAWAHRFESGGLNAVRDVTTLRAAGTLDWPTLVAAARESGAERCCYWLLRLARVTSELPVPDDVLGALQPRHGARSLRILERHLLHVMFRAPTACPSVRLRRHLWALALGVPACEPADGDPWAAGHTPAPPTPARRALWRVTTHIRRVPHWTRYAATLVRSAMLEGA